MGSKTCGVRGHLRSTLHFAGQFWLARKWQRLWVLYHGPVGWGNRRSPHTYVLGSTQVSSTHNPVVATKQVAQILA